MKKSSNQRISQLIILIAVIFLLIRFFPFAVKAAEAAALGIREFWWLILVIVFAGWLFSLSKKQPPKE
jgi:hypothetical protein